MKKIILLAITAMIAGIGSADLSIKWTSQSGGISAPDGSTPLVGSTINLVWSDTAAITTAGSYNLGAMETAGDFYVLREGVTGGNSLWLYTDVPIYDNSTVGGNNINSGFFYTRVFEATGAADEYFLDLSMGAGADYVYAATDAGSVYSSDVAPAGVFTPIDANNTIVAVPEPATIGLFGLGALGAWIIRRRKWQS